MFYALQCHGICFLVVLSAPDIAVANKPDHLEVTSMLIGSRFRFDSPFTFTHWYSAAEGGNFHQISLNEAHEDARTWQRLRGGGPPRGRP